MERENLTSAVLESAPCGIAVLRDDLVYELANPAFLELVGLEDVIGRRFAAAHAQADRLVPVLADVARTGEPFDADDMPFDTPPGVGVPFRRRYLSLRVRALGVSGAQRALLVVAFETTASHVARRRAEALATAAIEVASAPSQEQALARVASIAREMFGAADCIALLADPDGDRMRGAFQVDGDRVEVAAELADLGAGSRAVQLRTPLYLTADVARGVEATWMKRAAVDGALCIPLGAGERARGLVYVTLPAQRAPQRHDLAFAGALGATCGLALERAAAYELERAGRVASEQATHRLEILAESGAVLSSATDWRAVVRATAQLPLGYLADVVVLDLVDEAGVLRRDAVERLAAPCDTLPDPPRADRSEVTAPPIRGALETLRPRRVTRRTGAAPATQDPDHALLDQLYATSCIVAPLVLRRRASGVLTLARRVGARPHDHEDVLLAAEIARRAALALDDARLVMAAQQELRRRDDFIALAAHELRTPLTVLQLATRMARAAGEPRTPPPALLRVERAVDRLSKVVDQLLAAVAAGAGEVPLAPEEVDLTAVVRQLLDELRELLSSSATEIRLHAAAAVVGRWDRFRVESIVTNLVTNAVKFGLGRPVEVEVAAVNGSAIIRVVDQGIGIPPEVQARVLGRYERGVSRSAYGGLGLGLWIVRRFAESQGGRVLLAGGPGEGTTVTVELPTAPSARGA